jgi:hypothetical protein
MPVYESVQLAFPNLALALDLSRNHAKLEPVIEGIRGHALERIKLNAPIDTGEFRQSLFVEAEIKSDTIVFHFGSKLEERVYRLHEAQYQLGPTSAVQPNTVEGGVGNKFFTRVIDYWADRWAAAIAERIFNIMLEGKSS